MESLGENCRKEIGPKVFRKKERKKEENKN